MPDQQPPKVIFYAETGGKTGPLYLALRGIRSWRKTNVRAQLGMDQQPIRVYRGEVTWTEIDLETGAPR